MRKIKSLWAYLQQGRPYKSIPAQILDLIICRIFLRVIPREYYTFEFYRPDISYEQRKRYVGTQGSVYWPYENNPRKYTTTLNSKYIQKHLLIGFGLPTPPLLHVVGSGHELHDKAAFCDAIGQLREDFMLKPCQGAKGNHIKVVRVENEILYMSGKEVRADDLWKYIEPHFHNGFLIEKRIRNADYIRVLNPDCLNTFRVSMIKTDDGVWHVACVTLKVGAKNSDVDNWSAGGMIVNFDRDGAFDGVENLRNGKPPEITPALKALRIQDYDQLLSLAHLASQKFNFMGTIGWDIAHTDQGYMVIEGNTLWGPEPKPIITDELARGLKYHGPFSKWKPGGMRPISSI